MHITIKQSGGTIFKLNEDMNDWQCAHEDAYVEPACCNGSPDECGRDTCGCHGQDSVICPAVDCTGIEEWEIDELMARVS